MVVSVVTSAWSASYGSVEQIERFMDRFAGLETSSASTALTSAQVEAATTQRTEAQRVDLLWLVAEC